MLLVCLVTLGITNACCTNNSENTAIDYTLPIRPRMGIVFWADGDILYARFPSNQVIEINVETLKFFNDYNADIVAYEQEIQVILDYYKSMLFVE